MTHMKKLVIIPAYNEEKGILGVVRKLQQDAPDFDYIVINDCSRDNTEQVLRENRINHVTLPVNLGIGGAVHTGFIYARRKNYDCAVQIDGDGQHDTAYLQEMADELEKSGADMVIGSRFITYEGFQTSFMRRVGKTYLSGLIHLVTGKKVTDPTSGYRMVNRQGIELFAGDYPRDYPEPESIVTLLRAGGTVKDHPVIMQERQGGVSSIGPWKAVYYMVKVTLAILIETMRPRTVRFKR